MHTPDCDTQPITAEPAASTAAAELFFRTEKGVPACLLDEATLAGIVQLTSCPVTLMACRAIRPALRRHNYAARSDADIAAAVRAAFRVAPRGRSCHPTSVVHRSIVTLSGTVPNLRAKQAAARAARAVAGVRDVRNLLHVRAPGLLPEPNILHCIKQALARAPGVGFFDFSVYVRNGKTARYGQVGSCFEQPAGAVASDAKGVADLGNWVSVAASPGFDGFEVYQPRPNADFALAERIRTRWFWSARLHNQAIEVLAENGCATLTGIVETWLDREQAADDAYCAGARCVANDLVVAPASRR